MKVLSLEAKKFIREKYPELGAKEIANKLELPEVSVRVWACKHKIRFKRPIPELLHLPDKFVGYIAGIIDGEGTVTIRFSHDKKGRVRLTPRISIVNTNKDMLSEIQRILGFGLLRPERKKSRLGRKTSWVLEFLSLDRVYQLLEAVKDLVIDKRERTQLLLEYCESRILSQTNAPYTDQQWKIRVKLFELNKRGVKKVE